MEKKNRSRAFIIILITILDIAYQLWPVDLLPDVAPVIGQIDDSIALLINVLAAVRLTIGQFKGAKKIAASGDQPNNPGA